MLQNRPNEYVADLVQALAGALLLWLLVMVER
jgi:hypothetical protein